MFRNFSFEAASRHPSDFDTDFSYNDISPTSTPFLMPSPRSYPNAQAHSMAEITQRFSEQSIQQEPRYTSYFDLPTTDSPDSSPQFSDFTFPSTRHSSFAYTSMSAASLRSQRQRNTRLQCDSSHIRDISSLVERMVDSGEQCVLCSPTTTSGSVSSASSDSEDQNEDFATIRRASTSALPSQTLKYRRSGERLRPAQAGVMKNPRKRKHRASKPSYGNTK